MQATIINPRPIKTAVPFSFFSSAEEISDIIPKMNKTKISQAAIQPRTSPDIEGSVGAIGIAGFMGSFGMTGRDSKIFG